MTMPADQQAVMEALANTIGWAVGPVRKGQRQNVKYRMDGEETRVELWFRDDAVGTARVRALLAAISKEATDTPQQAELPVTP